MSAAKPGTKISRHAPGVQRAKGDQRAKAEVGAYFSWVSGRSSLEEAETSVFPSMKSDRASVRFVVAAFGSIARDNKLLNLFRAGANEELKALIEEHRSFGYAPRNLPAPFAVRTFSRVLSGQACKAGVFLLAGSLDGWRKSFA